MHVYHPAQAYQGIPPENVFFSADSSNMTTGEGFVIHTYHPYLYPERPVNMFVNINTRGPGRDMLLGALLARAYQLRMQTPYLKARVFAQVPMTDGDLLAFYTDAGFQADDALDVVRIAPPAARPSAPMGYDLGRVPLSTPMELGGFVMRMNTYRMDVLQPGMVQRYMAMPHFLALYLSRGQEIVGEILWTGQSTLAKLMGLYILPNYRQMGLGKSLVAASMQMLSEQGVTDFEVDLIRRSIPQCRFAQACNATFVRTACLYPGLNYD